MFYFFNKLYIIEISMAHIYIFIIGHRTQTLMFAAIFVYGTANFGIQCYRYKNLNRFKMFIKRTIQVFCNNVILNNATF